MHRQVVQVYNSYSYDTNLKAYFKLIHDPVPNATNRVLASIKLIRQTKVWDQSVHL